ncbi:MAG TPA: hypothetical protein VFE06_00305 [Acidobacteriaceae bacterium]|jgi:hypothetical protein|nr:hypothetical protein [Acidobacteriaceae bacterium]
MKLSRQPSAVSARLLVRSASLLVPNRRRADWTAEWLAELWHVEHVSGTVSATSLNFAAGAVNDAFQLRAHSVRAQLMSRLRSLMQPGAPARCLLVLAAATLAALLLCLALPGARRVFLPSPYQHAASLVLISSSGSADLATPSIPVSDYREWTTNTAPLFSELAFYRVAGKTLHLADGPERRLVVAQASPNLLHLLGLRSASATAPALFLTHAAWRKHYRGDAHLVGRVSDIDGTPVPIAGILPADAWQLPGSIDAVLLENPATLAHLAPTTRGFAIARIRGAVFPPPRRGYRFMVETRHDVVYHFDCISLPWLLGQPFANVLLVLFLASIALPATLPLSLSEAPVRRGPLPRATLARRAAFLVAKLTLVPLLVLLCSIALTWGPRFDPNTAFLIQFVTGVPTLLFAFRWILHDQRHRCPECLRVLSNPARVGQASCNFLAWNGTELLCVRGHGLLHIPELPTSWFSTQRWLALDSSWLCLFAEQGNPSPEPI